MGIRHLVLVLGDQLDCDSAAFDGFDPQHDRVLMAEVSAVPPGATASRAIREREAALRARWANHLT